MNSVLKQLRDNLELLPITELRSKASRQFGIRPSRDHTKEDIINLIVGVASKADFADVAKTDKPLPGWARIKAHPVPGRPTFPFYVGVNGYFIWVPYNYEVDVPIKIIKVLDDAVENRIMTDEFGAQTSRLDQSYPYSLLAVTEGPDPRPGFEVARERKLADKRKFAEENGFWPKSKDVEAARNAKMLGNALRPATT